MLETGLSAYSYHESVSGWRVIILANGNETLGACIVDITAKTVRGGVLTREQFLLAEMRIVAALRLQGVDDDAIAQRVKRENLFQYPTERMLANRARVCTCRLDALVPTEGECAARGINPQAAADAASAITRFIAEGPHDQAAQANMYAMMCRYDIVREFMLVEIAERMMAFDYTLTAADLDAFMVRFQMQYADAASWSDATVKRIKGTLRGCLKEAGLIAGPRSTTLTPLFIDADLQAAIEALGDVAVIPAFTGQGV